MSGFDTEVLVVGAGPTGLTLAAELVSRGIDCRVVDGAIGRSDKSRALVVQPRTLEVFRAMGFAETLVAAGQRAFDVSIHVAGRRVAHARIDDLGLEGTPYPFILFVSQAETERCLDAHLAGLGGQVERPVKLVSLRDEGTGVVAELSAPSGPEIVRACYVVGCDGAHSSVRHEAGIAFEGDAYPQDFMLADVDCDWVHGHGGVHLFFGRRGVFACLPLRGERAYRFVTIRSLGDAAPDADPTLEEVRAVGEAMTDTELRLSNPHWLARFRLHHRGVDRYSKGRVFVAGDAAHIHSPAGGQGMNTGIQDAYNLGWKLALVLRGRAHQTLLESYHAERHPVGQLLLQFTDRLFRVGSSANWFLAQLRMLVVPRLAPIAFGSAFGRRRAFRFVSQLAVHYRSGPLALEPRSGRPLGTRVRAGDRAPDAELDSGLRLFDRFARRGFSLLAFVADPTHAATTHAALVAALGPSPHEAAVTCVTRPGSGPREGVVVDERGDAFERYGVATDALFLVRPDGYVATRTTGLDPTPVLAFFAQAL